MGCYDVVKVPCPACGTVEPAQSKGGDCRLLSYDLSDCPMDVLSDVNRHAPFTCEKCKTKFWVVFDAKVVRYPEEVSNALPGKRWR